MFPDTTYRSKEVEIMDDLEMEGDTLTRSLNYIARVNQILGGNGITVRAVKVLLEGKDKTNIYRILDVGCGNGDMLRAIAKWGRRAGFQLELVGVDANQATIHYAEELSREFPEISYQRQDILDKEYPFRDFDITLCTLCLHHFEDEVAIELLRRMAKKSKLGIVVNDLHRSRLAYSLFWLITLFVNNRMVRTDGLISILRGFKRNELEAYSKTLNLPTSIKWRWAFRYEWIIQK